MPSMGEVILVKLRFSWAFSRAAWAARTCASAATMFASATATPDLGRLDGGTGRKFHADRVIEVLLAKGILFGQRLDARQIGFGRGPPRVLDVHLGLGPFQGGFGLCDSPLSLLQDGLRLFDGGLELPRVDLEQHLALADEIAFLVILLDEIALDLGPDRGIHEAVQRSDPLGEDGNVFRHHLGDLHDRGRRGPCFLFLLATGNHQGRRQDEEKSRPEGPEKTLPSFSSENSAKNTMNVHRLSLSSFSEQWKIIVDDETHIVDGEPGRIPTPRGHVGIPGPEPKPFQPFPLGPPLQIKIVFILLDDGRIGGRIDRPPPVDPERISGELFQAETGEII